MKYIFALLMLAFASPTLANDLVGHASIIDGDTLQIHGTRIRLFGIDAPESDQTCHDDDGKLYRCGQKAANALEEFIGGRVVSCVAVDLQRSGATAATCAVDETDLGDWLVRSGLALDWPQFSKGKYTAAQKAAERAGDGLWGGQWVTPWQYRSCRRAGRSAERCSENAAY